MSRSKRNSILDTFGLTLGWSAKKWVKAYGNIWQYRLAGHIVRGDKFVKVDWGHTTTSLRVPNAGEQFKKEAKAYLKAFKAERANPFTGKFTWDNYKLTTKQEIFNQRVLHGRRKVLDPTGQQISRIYQSAILNATDLKIRKLLKKEYERFLYEGKRYVFELKAEGKLNQTQDSKQVPRGDVLRNLPDYAKELKKIAGNIDPAVFERYGDPVSEHESVYEGAESFDRTLEKLKSVTGAFFTQKEDDMASAAMESLRALEEDREPGQKKEPTVHESGDRLIEYLKKAKSYRRDVYEGIRDSVYAWKMIEKKFGRE